MRLVRADEAARRRARKERAQRRRRTGALTAFGIGVSFFVLLIANAVRPLPTVALTLDTSRLEMPAEVTTLSWPAKGQAAVYVNDYGMIGSFGANDPMPTASIAKVITALCVLAERPIAVGEAGPTITFSKSDVALYQYQLEHNGSNVPVYEGTQMTEYQAIEALMIPSANNIADSLAIWAFGSLDAYAEYANDFVLRNELVNTHVGIDASGLDSSTTSTAADIARLAALARENPVIMEIAGKTNTELPLAGTVYNYNRALGNAGINGLKTGNNDGNRGALAFTADVQVAGRTLEVSGSVMGQDSLSEAIARSISLVSSVSQNFELVDVLAENEVVGEGMTSWGESATIIATKPVTLLRWKGSAVSTKYTVHDTAGVTDETVGALEIDAGAVKASTTLRVGTAANQPTFWWRATRMPTI